MMIEVFTFYKYCVWFSIVTLYSYNSDAQLYFNLQDGNTPLHLAASKGDAEVVDILLRHIQHKGSADVINTKNNVSYLAIILELQFTSKGSSSIIGMSNQQQSDW